MGVEVISAPIWQFDRERRKYVAHMLIMDIRELLDEVGSDELPETRQVPSMKMIPTQEVVDAVAK